MRGLFFLALIALLLGAGMVALIDSEPGYLLVAYRDYTVETSLWIGLLLIALIVLTLYAALRLLHRVLASPGSLLFWATSRKRRQAARLTNRGLMNFIEGNWKQARRQLQRGAQYSDAPAFNHLMAARASFQLEDRSQMRGDLEAALASDSQSAAAVDLVQAELQLQSAQYGRALASLDRAETSGSRTPQSLRLRSKALLALSDWEGLRALLPDLQKHEVLSARKLARLRRETAVRLLRVAAGDLGDNTVTALQRAWKQTPTDLQNDERVLHRYVALLASAGATEEALSLIVRILKKRWDSVLVEQFGRLPGKNPQQQLALAEGWLVGREKEPTLLLCLGRLAARQRLWGQARDYFERSISVDPGDAACAELGRLLAASGDYLQASQYFCAGLALQDRGLPELPLPGEPVAEDRLIAADTDARKD
ncbi:MAG: heme biosynthesis HemY N-terminal domain-containing protein [Chromatocurvus sp.]